MNNPLDPLTYPNISVGNWYEPPYVPEEEYEARTAQEVTWDRAEKLFREVLESRGVKVPRIVSEELLEALIKNGLNVFQRPKPVYESNKVRFEEEDSEPVDAYSGKVYDCENDFFIDAQDAIEKGRLLLSAGYESEQLELEGF